MSYDIDYYRLGEFPGEIFKTIKYNNIINKCAQSRTSPTGFRRVSTDNNYYNRHPVTFRRRLSSMS